MKKTSKISMLTVLSLAGAVFIGSSFTAPTPAKADAVTATILAGSALGLTLWHDPWPVRAVVSPFTYVYDRVTGDGHGHGHGHHGHGRGYYGAYDHYVHVGVPQHSHVGMMPVTITPMEKHECHGAAAQ
ncbi:MAG: hypothetical protein HQL75_09765 [Magnetococcales bacterium]|nr:hypothetical protein [Magnetococcales bacterium]